MCIFLVSTEHVEFPFILLDNRDEVLSRPTAPAHWWDSSPDIYAPQDLLRDERGTWIGITRSGRVTVLVNYFEETPPARCEISRGALPKQYLESHLPPKEWVKTIERDHSDELKNCGGFTLLVGEIKPGAGEQSSIEIDFLTNERTELPQTDSHMTLSLSNGSIRDKSWIKTTNALQKLKPIMEITNPTEFSNAGIELLSTVSSEPLKSRHDLRKHIFVPAFPKLEGSPYGTQVQTTIVIDKSGCVHYTEVNTITNETKTEVFQIK